MYRAFEYVQMWLTNLQTRLSAPNYSSFTEPGFYASSFSMAVYEDFYWGINSAFKVQP